MIQLLNIIGARPQIIKAAAISRAVRGRFSRVVEEKILHTGQHYDPAMSDVFFKELEIPNPDYNLGVGSLPHGEQTARMIAGIEKVLAGERFDGVILYGDTNSTLAGAVAASKMGIPVFHVEAGLRSFNMAMPEEINRIVCDHLSSILFAPTRAAVDNLRAEGLTDSPAKFGDDKGRKVVEAGDVMYDNALHFSEIAEKKSRILEEVGVKPGEYALSTVHRNFNTDSPERLEAIFKALSYIAENKSVPVVIPLHPRTRKHLPSGLSSNIRVIPPASFFDILNLEKNAKLVITDSGGVQKEAFFFSKPCIILRPETEWVEIVENGAGILADADYHRIIEAYGRLAGTQVVFPPLYGNGDSSERILSEIVVYLG